MRGILSKNYVAAELSAKGITPYYLASINKAEVDFVIQTGGNAIPVEVKSADNVRSKSLKIYSDKYKPEFSFRFSTKNFGVENGIKSVPLYGVFTV